MKKKLQLLLVAITLLLPLTAVVVSPRASAVDIFQNSCAGSSTDICKEIPQHGTPGKNPIIKIIGVAIAIVGAIVGIAAVFVLIIGGFKLITANGDSQGVARARSSVIYALVGVVISVLAEGIVAFVLSKAG